MRPRPLAVALVLVPLVAPLATGAAQAGAAKTRRLAVSQHEIVMLLLEKKEFGKAKAEAARMFEMKWSEAEEPTFLDELVFLADQFLHHSHPELGVELLDVSEKSFKTVKSRVKILQEKGFLYKRLKQNDKAIDCFREAQKLERFGPPPPR